MKFDKAYFPELNPMLGFVFTSGKLTVWLWRWAFMWRLDRA